MTRDRYFLFAADTIFFLQQTQFASKPPTLKKRIVSAVEFGIVKKKIEMK